MRKVLNKIGVGSLYVALVVSAIPFSFGQLKTHKVNAETKPTTINTNANTETEIRNYYSYLNDLPESERKGQNLLKNLQLILSTNPSNPSKTPRYFSYADVRLIYNITDRSWSKSPASEIPGYDASTGIISNYSYSSENPYLYYYYRSDNFTNPHYADAESHSKEGKSAVMLNQEHLWSVSHGFKGEKNLPNAGTDLHHLVAADQAVNKWGHSNYTYGYVDKEDASWSAARENWDNNENAILGNKLGTIKNTHSLDESNKVFEPQDIDKGDVARALFYMAARYNYVGRDETQATQANPDLLLVDYATDESVTHTCDGTNGPGKYGIVSDLLDWHKKDIVTSSSPEGQYEIHRNDLIYNNYQYTRNPFIDFPLWADYIWGNKSGAANPATDPINGYNTGGGEDVPTGISVSFESSTIGPGESTKANVSVVPSTATNAVTWSSSDTNVASVSSSGVVQGISDGTATITATSVKDSSIVGSAVITVQTIALTGLSFANINTTIASGKTSTIDVTFAPSNATNKDLNWSSSNTDVASINNGQIVGNKCGFAVITATSVANPAITASINVFVTTCVDTSYIYQKVTNVNDIETGKYIIFNEARGEALNANLDSGSIGNTNNYTDLTEFYDSTKKTIVSNDASDATAFTIIVNDGKISIYSTAGQYYIGKETADNGIDTSDTVAYQNSYSIDANGNIVITSNDVSDYRLQYYAASHVFRYYKTNQGAIQLYKCVEQKGEVIKQSFKRITSMAEATTGMYILAAEATDDTIYTLGNTFPTSASTIAGTAITVTDDAISYNDGKDKYVYLNIDSNNQVSVSNNNKYLTYNDINKTHVVATSTPFKWSLSDSSNLFTFLNPTKGTSQRKLGFNTSNNCFGHYYTATFKNLLLFKYVEEIDSDYSYEDFANDFLDNLLCDSSGATAPTFNTGYSWELFASRFSSLSADDQEILRLANPSETSSYVHERAMCRYDYIVRKYEYDNFIGREISGNSNNFDKTIKNKDHVALILIITLVTGISCLAVSLILREKKKRKSVK